MFNPVSYINFVQPTVMFNPVAYTLATEDAERIGVDHIARSSVAGTTQTSAGAEVICLSFSLKDSSLLVTKFCIGA